MTENKNLNVKNYFAMLKKLYTNVKVFVQTNLQKYVIIIKQARQFSNFERG